VLRQAGHFLFEADHSVGEQAKIGFRNNSKRATIGMFLLLNAVLFAAGERDYAHLLNLNLGVVIGLKVATACVYIGIWKTMLWLIKIVTDPFTDIADFGPSTWLDFFTDTKVRNLTLDENFRPKFAPKGRLDIGKVLFSYLIPIAGPAQDSTDLGKKVA
jgi:hypothetical protein